MLRAIGAGALLSIGLSGCYGPEGGVPEAFCGFLYSCGNHGGGDDGSGPPPDPDPPSPSPAAAAAATGEETGEESTAPTGN
jgi:hypothetical protein